VAGYAFLSVLFAALCEVFRGRRPVQMLAVASLALGLAVGCHPNHVFLLPILAWAAVFAVRSRANGVTAIRGVLAAALPVGALGVALAWYNYARFGNILEFGFSYGQNGFFLTKKSLFAARYLLANWKWYLFTPPSVVPFFPFVFPGDNSFRPSGYEGAEAMVGILPITVLGAWTLGGALATRFWDRLRGDSARFYVALALAALAALLFVGSLQIRANRYMVDFAAPLSLIAAAAVCGTWNSWRRGKAGSLWKAGCSAIVTAGSVTLLLGAIQQFDLFRNTRPASFAALSRALNIPYEWLYSTGFWRPGMVKMRVRFVPHSDAVVEPLVTTGTPGYSDSFYVAQYPTHQIQFSLNHKGYGGPSSALLSIDLGKDHLIEMSMGSLYPPSTDRYMGRYSPQSAALLKLLAYVRVDGTVVLGSTMDTYNAAPWSLEFGRNDVTLTEFKRTFTGSILSADVVPIEPLLDRFAQAGMTGVLRYKVRFSTLAPVSGWPLLGIGIQGKGNLILARSLGGDRYELEMDDWGRGLDVGGRFVVTDKEHDLEFVVGPVLLSRAIPAVWGDRQQLSILSDRVVVSFDGAIVGCFRIQHHTDHLFPLTPGSNPQGFSTAVATFDGSFEPYPMIDSDVRDFLSRAAASAAR
jgi:hypothetical protein